MDKIIFNIPIKLKQDFKILVVKQKKDMTEVLVSLIEKYVEEAENGQQTV